MLFAYESLLYGSDICFLWFCVTAPKRFFISREALFVSRLNFLLSFQRFPPKKAAIAMAAMYKMIMLMPSSYLP